MLRGAGADDADEAELLREALSTAASGAGGELLRVLVTVAASGAGAERSGGRA
jgi:hypothetical protein